jgi:hypothetical protein
MALVEFLKESLPTPWSRKVAIASWTLAITLLFLPEWWPKIGLDPTEQPPLWPRLFAVSTILFLGSSICLALVVRHYRKPTPRNQPIVQSARLDEIREQFLQLLVSHPNITSPQIARAIDKSPELVTFHLTEMEKAKLVHGSYYLGGDAEWSIAQNGRAYLVRNGLLA